jgi:hypothetical protein
VQKYKKEVKIGRIQENICTFAADYLSFDEKMDYRHIDWYLFVNGLPNSRDAITIYDSRWWSG